MNPQKDRVYFKGLHALRFFAAAFVLISHMEMIKEGLKIKNIYNNGSFLGYVLESLGPMGVTFFFVLSGFLITYLLLVEKKKTTTVNVKSFYIRRALRIWPIYILFTVLAFFLFPEMEIFNHYYLSSFVEESKATKLVMYLLFIPGFVLAFFKSIPWAGHLWSIGVEEQFYLAWPWLFKVKKRLNVNFLLWGVLILVVCKAFILLLSQIGYISTEVKEIVAQSKFECMIIGGIGALLFYNDKLGLLLKYITRNPVLLLLFILSLLLTWFTPEILNDGKHLLVSPFFLMLILGISQGKDRSFFESKLFVFLGNISYGFYLFHMVCAVLVIRSMPNTVSYWCAHNPNGGVWINLIYYLGSIVATCLVSAFSYALIEHPILRFKSKFAVIKSGKL